MVIIAKILFRVKQILNRKGFRTSSWPTARRACARRAEGISPHKTNGRHKVPPTDSLVKNRKIKSWSIYTITLEPTLSKIPDQRKPPHRVLASATEILACLV